MRHGGDLASKRLRGERKRTRCHLTIAEAVKRAEAETKTDVGGGLGRTEGRRPRGREANGGARGGHTCSSGESSSLALPHASLTALGSARSGPGEGLTVVLVLVVVLSVGRQGRVGHFEGRSGDWNDDGARSGRRRSKRRCKQRRRAGILAKSQGRGGSWKRRPSDGGGRRF